MTVGEWIRAAEPAAPDGLLARIGQALGPGATQPAERTAEVCLDGAIAMLRSLVDDRRFSRAGALDLLAADALMTYAFEHAATHGDLAALTDLCRRAERATAEVATPRA